jgi:hypothetical protein
MHLSKHCRTPLCHTPLYVGVLMITGLWIAYIALLVLHPELLKIDETLFQVNLWYAICAIATTLVAYIETARHLKEEQTDTDHALCTQEV